MARCNARRELADAGVERAVEAQVLADLGHALEQDGTAKQRNERPVDALARTVDQCLRRGSLRFVERAHRRQGQARGRAADMALAKRNGISHSSAPCKGTTAKSPATGRAAERTGRRPRSRVRA